MATFQDFVEALEEGLHPRRSASGPPAITASAANLSRNTEGSEPGVMTDAGPENARAYTAILAGRETPAPAAGAGAPGGGFRNIAGGAATLPPEIEELSDAELRSLVNQMHGGRKAGPRASRDRLLRIAATSLGYAEPPSLPSGTAPVTSQPATPGPGLGYSSILASPPPPSTPPIPDEAQPRGTTSGSGQGYSSIMAGPPPLPTSPADATGGRQGPTESRGVRPSTTTGGGVRPPEPPIVATGAPGDADEPSRLTEALQRLTEAVTEASRHEERTVAQDVKGLSWQQRGERLKRSGNLLSDEEVRQSTLKQPVLPRDIVRESERREQQGRDAKQQERTVAQDTKGLSWRERRERLEGLGNLLSDEEVRQAALRQAVGPRDIIQESERREQRQRDAKQVGRTTAVKDAAESVGRSVENSVGGVLSRVMGPSIGGAIGQTVGRITSSVASRIAGRAAGGAATAAGGRLAGGAAAGIGGAVGRLGMAALTNPWVAVGVAATAAAVALLRLPWSSQRLAKSFIDSQRQIARYSATMQAMFARMDYQERVLSARQARTTGGSTSLLGGQYMALRSETLWSREAWTTGKNLFGTGMVVLGRLVNVLIKADASVRSVLTILGAIEGSLGNPEVPTAIDSYLQMFGREYQAQPRNRTPRRGGNDDEEN